MVVSHPSELVPTPDGSEKTSLVKSDTSGCDAWEPLGHLSEGEC